MIKNEKGDIIGYILVSIVVILLIWFIGFCIFSIAEQYSNEQTREITVKDKYIKNNGNKSSDKYLVVDTNNNTYEITDLILKGKWDSTDIYNQLDINHKYLIKTTGNRIHWLSKYPNINEIQFME